jgi:hypothetical protein
MGIALKKILQIDKTNVDRALAALRIGLTHNESDFLRAMLATGPAPVDSIMAAAKLVGFTRVMIKRARRDLGIVSYRTRAGGWKWELPS